MAISENAISSGTSKFYASKTYVPSFLSRQAIFLPFNNKADKIALTPIGDYFSFLRFSLYVDSGDHTQDPIISDPTTWGTKNNTNLVELMTSGTPCTPEDGTIVPEKVSPKWDYINLYATGFYTAPVTGNYKFTIESDDAVTIKLNGVIILTGQGYDTPFAGETSGISLTVGIKYPLEILWSNGQGGLKLCSTAIKVGVTNIQPTYPFNDSCSPTP